jgi:aarF domain-containing kinase
MVRAPAVLSELSTSSVLVMEWIDGSRLSDADAVMKAGLTPGHLLERGVRCSLHQLLTTGFMHSDPHPGNLLVSPDGVLVYLDFGMVVEVSPRVRRAMIRGLVGFVNRDADGLVRDLTTLDFLPCDVDHAAASDALRTVFEASASSSNGGNEEAVTLPSGSAVRGTNDFLGVVSQLSAALLTHDFRLPPYFARILRALAALEGTATGIDREFKVIERAYPYVLAQLLADNDPEMRDILRRLVLEPCGTSVRWHRVRRLLNAYVSSGGGSSTSRGTYAEGVPGSTPFGGCRATETAAGLAAGARAVLFGPGMREEDDDTVKQVKDAVEYVMSPSGASLRVTLVRDFLDAMDSYLEVLEESGGSGGGGGSEGELFLGAEDLEKLAETGRSVYLRAPEAWAPVVVNVVARKEACEMAERVVQGVSERVTRDNARRVARRVVDHLFGSEP